MKTGHLNLRAMKGRPRGAGRLEDREFYALSRQEQLTVIETCLGRALEAVAAARRTTHGARAAAPLNHVAVQSAEARRLIGLMGGRS